MNRVSKFSLWVGVFVTLVFLLGCGSSNYTSGNRSSVGASNASVPVPKGTSYAEIVGNIGKYKGREIEVAGKIFKAPERAGKNVAFQMYMNPDKSEGNTIVRGLDSTPPVAADNYVTIKGTVKGIFEGQNAFGGTIQALEIDATEIKITTRAEAIAPTRQSVPVGQQINMAGFVVTLEKIELADVETRFYVSAANNSGSKANLSTYSAKVIQGGAQLEIVNLFGDDATKLPSEILSGVTARGILTFPKIDPNIKQITLAIGKPYFDNYALYDAAQDVSFNVTLP